MKQSRSDLRPRELQSRLDLSLRCLVELAGEPGYAVGPVRAEHITEMLRDAEPEDVTALVCGTGPMMEVATDALLAAGVPADSIRYERFDYGAGRGRLDRARQTEALAVFLALVATIVVFSLRSLTTAPTD